MRFQTPWGESDGPGKPIAEGITCVSTASHGGYCLSPDRLAQFKVKLPLFKPFAGLESWFAEDCDWAALCICWPNLWPAEALSHAVAIARRHLEPAPWRKPESAAGWKQVAERGEMLVAGGWVAA